MQTRTEISPWLAGLAAAQAGTVTREQALAAGLTRHVIERLVSTERWRPLARGVYSTAPAPPTTPERQRENPEYWNGLAWGGVLVGGQGARLGSLSSAHLHGLLIDPPLPLDVLVPEGRVVRVAADFWTFARERAAFRSSRTVGEPPRLTVEDAVLDVCSGATQDEVIDLLTRAVQKRRTTPRRLLAQLGQRSRQAHRRLITDVLADVAVGVHSPLERTYLHRVERAHGLPGGLRQQRPGSPHRTDVLHEDYRLVVELDSRAWHDGTTAFRDMDRDNYHLIRGWITLRFGWYQVVHDPCRIAWQVAHVLQAQGWLGLPTRCARCAGVPDLDLLP